MSAIGKSIITEDGINALANASASGTSIKPKYFRLSNQDLVLSKNLTASDINCWLTQDISMYQKIDNKTVEFICDVTPTQASDYTRICGLFLEDGTLFMVAKPPYPFPPSLRQTIKVQMVYQNIEDLVNFQYISFDEEKQNMSIVHTAVSCGLEIMENAKQIGLIKQKIGVN